MRRAVTDRASGRLRKEKEHESHLCLASVVFTEDGGPVYMSLQASRSWLDKSKCRVFCLNCLCPGARGVDESVV